MTSRISGKPQITGISYNGVLLQEDLTLTNYISGRVTLEGYMFNNTINVLISANKETAYNELTSVSIFDPPISGQFVPFNIKNDNKIVINGINVNSDASETKIRFIPYNIAGYDFSDLSYLDVLSGRGTPTTFINILQQPIMFERDVVETLTFYSSIETTWRTISSVSNPNSEEDKFRFLNNPTTLSGEWNTEWWGYNSRDIYNFSGTTYKAIGYTSENNITLITPKHGVCNRHWEDYGDKNPQPGDIVFFYDHTTGAAVSAKVENTHTPAPANRDHDIEMVKFDRDITALGDIKVYKLPLYVEPVEEDAYCTIYQAGNGSFGTMVDSRHAGLGSHRGISDVTGRNILFDTEFGATDLWSVSSIFDGTYFALSSLDSGDSSSPTFIIYDNDILLASTFWTANGSGANFGLSAIQTDLKSGIEILGNTEGYILSTVTLS